MEDRGEPKEEDTMSIELIPLGSRLIIRLDSVEARMAGRIYVPDNHREPTRFATIVSVGPDVEEPFVPGQRIFVGFHVGNVIEHPAMTQYGDTLRIVEAGEIWGYVREGDDGELGLRQAEGGTETPLGTANGLDNPN